MSVIVENLSFAYDSRPVLDSVSFVAERGHFLSVLGANGVGKSTLFRCILGLLKGYRGSIRVEDQDVRHLSPREMAKRIAYIPQSHDPSFNYTVFDMVLMGTTGQVAAVSSPGKKQMALAEQAIERLGITALHNRGFNQISGGERQLTMIARALAQNAHVLILDEPTANLDFGNQIKVLSRIRSLAEEGYTVIQATHNPDQTFLFSDRILALKDGRVLASGSPSEIVSTDLMQTLYGVDIAVQSLYDDTVRVCIPKAAIQRPVR